MDFPVEDEPWRDSFRVRIVLANLEKYFLLYLESIIIIIIILFCFILFLLVFDCDWPCLPVVNFLSKEIIQLLF
jgi:hypothetical protein